jgi:capsular exopolysaccharide synthesis family protein
MEQRNIDRPFSEEEESGFDIMEWVSYFLHYWYLFIMGIIISLGLAYFQNRSWIPTFRSAGRVIIEENRASANSSQALMQGFGVQSGYKSSANQLIILHSYDLISRVVDSLPDMRIDYISKGSFKTRNLYKTSPITIHDEFVSQEAYNNLFKIKLQSNGTFTITVEDNKLLKNFKLNGKYGEPVQCNLFFITVNNINKFTGESEMYFQFRTKESLVDEFSSLSLNYISENSSVLEISIASETPDRDIDFINKLCEIFLADNLEKKNDAANKTIKFIDEQLSLVQKSLLTSEGRMTSYRQANKIVDVTSHTGELLGKASKFDNQQDEFKLREMYLDYLTKYLKTSMAEGSIIAPPSSFGLNEPLLMSEVQQINELFSNRSQTPKINPYYAKYTKQIETAKQTVLEVIKNLRAALEIEKNDFKRRYAIVNKQIDELPEKEIQMNSIDRKYKMDDNYYTFFLQKRAESEILKASNAPDNTILEKARVQSITNSGTKSKTTMMFLLFGLLIPTLFVIVKELLNNTVRSTKDIEKNSDFSLIGAVRHTKSTDPLLVSKNPRSAFTEMFRVIRTRVEFVVKRKSNILILITSTESGDGKTYFSINLASIYSMASKKTLLVDMDIRKPSVNQRFNIVQPIGVTNYLVGQCSLDEVILQLPKVDYDILPAGSIPPNPGELIRSEKLIEMFAELRKRYDFIIVDTSPIGMVTDAYSLTNLSDINLFVVRNSKTNKTFFKKLSTQLKTDNIPNIYTVLNDVADDGTRYSRYKLYKYAYLFGYNYGYTNKKRKMEAEKYLHYYEDDSEL